MSTRRKRAKRSPKNLERESNSEEEPCKRAKTVKSEEEQKTIKKKNFVDACRQVSCNAYSDHRARLLLVYLPACSKKQVCKHNDKNGKDIREMTGYAEEIFRSDIMHDAWYDALEVCIMCITPDQYLSAYVLKEIVEIMLNFNEDDLIDQTAPEIIDKCQQILGQIFSTHPPCSKRLRTCYLSFLTSPMDPKEKTFTNRGQFDYRSGIVKYCMNRLENEISSDSQDGPLINKSEKIPEEMKQSLQGLHWQKEKLVIYEVLNRPDRIERLMAVLESIVEILQFDLAIWHSKQEGSRPTNDLSRHIMKMHKPLMAYLLWPNNASHMGGVTHTCRQIMRLFVRLIHLRYPDSMIKIITNWLNIMVQTFYTCDQNSNTNYPNISKYCTKFANEFYKIITEMPQDSINRILDRIEPAFMRHLIGMLHIRKTTKINNDCIISILINFFKESQWQLYTPDDTEIVIPRKLFPKPKKIKNLINFVINDIKECMTLEVEEKIEYAKFDKKDIKTSTSSTARHSRLYYMVHTLYTTFEAYLDAYDVLTVEETWNKLNKQMSEGIPIIPENSSYYVTKDLIEKYKDIMKKCKELQTVFNHLKSSGELPDMLEIFTNIEFLE